ncbi:MAG: FAD-dependent oxidoreductase [Clostridiales bacterium]|nr:FAD-dependent oxidoreductase [Clostridiales bacterium]
MKTLIVGGVAGGASAAARLRRLDESAEIIMFERGEHISFANCGLPYYIGGEIKEKSALTLQTPKSFNARFNVDVRNFSEVVGIDREKKTVEVKKIQTGEIYTESYDKLILSPGASPIRPPIEGIDNPKVFTLRNIPDTYRIKDFIDQNEPQSAVVVGGGYIGVEMAESLHAAGLDVTVVELMDHVIATIDYEMACDVHNHMRQKGVNLILKDGVKAVEDDGDRLKISLNNSEFYSDMVILSVGVRPESDLAARADLTLNERGAIVVNDNMQTDDENIYAVGDAIEITDTVTGTKGIVPLAGPANKQGRIAADNINGIKSRYRGTQGTGILKCFDLTVACTGITEARAKQLGLDFDKSYTYSASHATYYPGAVNMSVKVIYEKDGGKLLGAQVVGYEGSDKRIDVFATAIHAGMTVYDLTELELAYAPPFSSAKDPVNMAGFVAENILENKTKTFHWDQVADLPRDGSVTLLDIRTEAEYENGYIDGFVNIPVDSLRDNLDKIDKTKPAYIACQVGLRGHIACRILSQNGIECYNLSGGYRLWQSVFRGVVPTAKDALLDMDTMRPLSKKIAVSVDACGLQCPGPITKLAQAVKDANEGDLIEIKTTDPGFATDVEAWCRRTGNTFDSVTSEKGVTTVLLYKGGGEECLPPSHAGDKKNLVVFSGDLDKAIASFIIANGSAAMGRETTMFFTFWGLNILRKPEKVKVSKNFIAKMFGAMMPRGPKKLGLSKMNMGGMGAKMIKDIMKKHNVDSLEDMIKMAMENGVELVACSMSMELMGIQEQELIEGVKLGGVAAMLANAEESDMSLFI